jgi:hypothetical protein
VIAREGDVANPVDIRVHASSRVRDHRLLGPALPQLRHGIDGLLSVLVALFGGGQVRDSERLRGGESRDGVPARTSAGDLLERRELACEPVGIGEERRGGPHQADPRGVRGDRREDREGLERRLRVSRERGAVETDEVDVEQRIQTGRLGLPRPFDVALERDDLGKVAIRILSPGPALADERHRAHERQATGHGPSR